MLKSIARSNAPDPVRAFGAALGFALLVLAGPVAAGQQRYEPLSNQVRTVLATAVAEDRAPPEPHFVSIEHRTRWLLEMAERLPERHKPGMRERVDFLKTVRYEAQRAGLEPELVLGIIEVESGFRRYAISSAGARGYMQVMPFWTRLIGDGDPATLFDMRTNIRFGCVILRHYLDMERGDLFRALGRYNGSLGRAAYPNLVLRAWKKWRAGASEIRRSMI
ncbi:MAG: lytic transglycosylase domain-containing protein [Burkholderiales bacterium]|nr:MAG: lytic transglycosylase domain-containing protein [Burkholderiales bacterium]